MSNTSFQGGKNFSRGALPPCAAPSYRPGREGLDEQNILRQPTAGTSVVF